MGAPLKIFSTARWDYAGCGYFLSEAINAHTPHHSRAAKVHKSTLEFPYDMIGLTNQRIKALWDWADVIHIHDAAAALNLARFPNKPTVVTHHGTRFRKSPEAYKKHARANHWLATVATPDLTQFGLPWLPDCRPDFSEMYDPGDEFTVCHAPTKREVKGTKRVIEACKKVGVKLDLIEGVPWDECMRRKAKCHLLVDQFELGYGCNAIEAWSLRMPVISDGAIEQMTSLFDDIPFEIAGQTLAQSISRLRNNHDRYESLAALGRTHYESYHSPQAAAEQAVKFYHRAIEEWTPIPLKTKTPSPRRKDIESGKLVMMEYLGGSIGDAKWFPTSSGHRYLFGSRNPLRYVHKTDVKWFLSQRNKRNEPLFRVVE